MRTVYKVAVAAAAAAAAATAGALCSQPRDLAMRVACQFLPTELSEDHALHHGQHGWWEPPDTGVVVCTPEESTRCCSGPRRVLDAGSEFGRRLATPGWQPSRFLPYDGLLRLEDAAKPSTWCTPAGYDELSRLVYDSFRNSNRRYGIQLILHDGHCIEQLSAFWIFSGRPNYNSVRKYT